MTQFRHMILALSFGLNLAFGAVWLFHTLDRTPDKTVLPGQGTPPLSIFQEIQVTQKQWEQISPLVEGFKAAARVQGEQLNRLRCRLLSLMEAPVLDEVLINTVRKEMYVLNLDLKKKAIDLLLREKEFLDPLQYKSLIKELRRRSNCGKKGGYHGGSFMRILSSDPAVRDKDPSLPDSL